MRPRRTSQELEDLAGLLKDFGEEGWGPERAEEAFSILAERSDGLITAFPHIADLAFLVSAGEAFQAFLYTLCLELHLFLFNDILRNAGTFRHPLDPNGGIIVFGGMKSHTAKPLLYGAPAAEIENRLREAIALLTDMRSDVQSADDQVRNRSRENAADNAVMFYKEFSGLHPFYDANGRIGRYIVSIYLHVHQLHVDWSLVDEKERKFLKKINDCLRRSWPIAPYEHLLKRFWRKFVVDVESLEGDGH